MIVLYAYTEFSDGTAVRFGTSTIPDGPMGRSHYLQKWAKHNRQAFLKKLGINPRLAVAAGLEHGNVIENISRAITSDRSYCIEGADGLFTEFMNVPLIIAHKDCVPVFVWGVGEETTLTGILHAGWRGVLEGRIVPKAILTAQRKYGAKPGDLRISLGPAIQQCHFAVDGDVLVMFQEYYPDYVTERAGVCRVSLHDVIEAQARSAGVRAGHIKKNPDCTYCALQSERGDHLYFSFRRETHKGEEAPDNQMISVIARTKKEGH